jgi:hypothetical protein
MHLLRTSSQGNLIVIYPVVYQLSLAIRHQTKKKIIAPYRYSSNETQESTVHIGGHSANIIAKIYITHKKNEVLVQLYTDSGGGLIKVSKEQLHYMPVAPVTGWKTKL